ncbi:hypothetical protein F511_07643 [Dorcoceras hygrometricum]|uniref:Uncharacterized protein n=1 Tax=Dorcoceras hygrometricum TaxID=472368 RepID=A0A2Z7CJF0_9LAMI|nr:hypothetical protein F511_07643 [Dorcoceras hygrometricum]
MQPTNKRHTSILQPCFPNIETVDGAATRWHASITAPISKTCTTTLSRPPLDPTQPRSAQTKAQDVAACVDEADVLLPSSIVLQGCKPLHSKEVNAQPFLPFVLEAQQIHTSHARFKINTQAISRF